MTSPHDFAELVRLRDAADIDWGFPVWEVLDFTDCGYSPPAAEFMAAALNAVQDLLAVVAAAQALANQAVPQWAPELRAALARFTNVGEVRS